MHPGKYWSAALALSLCALAAQTGDAQSIAGMEWKIQNLRPTGQPVVPIFEGWLAREDGGRDLCFGYFNLNLEEDIEIPIGPDNNIEPASLNGRQPTHFDEVPDSHRRYYCTFTVALPPEAADDSVVWTLRQDGVTYSVPGDASVAEYRLEGLAQPSRGVVAPVLRFEGFSGKEGRGLAGLTAGPVNARVGVPLVVAAEVTGPDESTLSNPLVLWKKHQGPGAVSFSAEDVRLDEGETKATTQVTFAAPGTYTIRVQAVDGGRRSFGFACCWTNGYLTVEVAP
mgnify:CR=1 FL=1